MFAGIDVSKNWVDVAISGTGEVLQRAKPIKASKWLKKRGVTLVVLEATGGYELPVMHALAREKIGVSRINPRQIRQFAGALGIQAKTDATDAVVLSRYAEMVRPEPVELAAKTLMDLRALCMRRRDLVAMRTAERNRLQLSDYPFIVKMTKEIIANITMSISKIEKEIVLLIQSCPTLSEGYKRLVTMPGIGFVTAAMLLAYLPEMGSATRGEVASLVGLAPFTRQSGVWKGKSFCHGGRAPVREVLYMAAVAAIRSENRFRKKYLELTEKGKPAKLAIVAVMRKMLVVLNSMMQNNTVFAN